MKTIVLFSGGLDSAVVLARLIEEAKEDGDDVIALTFDYEQSNDYEVKSAAMLSALWGFPHRVVKIDMVKKDARFEIPARNTIFLAHALELALLEGASQVAYGAEPDATYCDSSREFIGAMREVFNLHGVELLAPVKEKQDKAAILHEALDLGVPLHLIHSSRTNHVVGCGTSARLLKALNTYFPFANPLDLLRLLADGHNLNPFDLRTRQTGSFKYWPALLTIATLAPREEPFQVTTTGNWGRSLLYCAELLQNHVPMLITKTDDLTLLKRSELHTMSTVAQWGIKQALSRLPRPRYLGAALRFPITQGHLLKAVLSLGYDEHKTGGLKLLTGL